VLPIQCGHCRAVNRPSSKFCDQYGNLLEQDSDPRTDTLKSERKHVTVLFSDISRYREMFNRVDPEEVREVTRHLFDEMVRIVSRYEGYVDRILWDGVLAVFGMPRTHEDDAIRALRAAIEIQRMVSRLERRYADHLGGALAMRSGVATGLVVTGSTEEKTGWEVPPKLFFRRHRSSDECFVWICWLGSLRFPHNSSRASIRLNGWI